MRGQVEGQLTLFQEGFLASPSLQPGSGEARKMTAISGQKWSGLSRNSGRLGLLERMLLESLRWHSPIFYLSWKPVDIGQGRFLYQLALSEPDTGVTGWRSWATPTAQDYKRRGPNSRQQGLPEQVRLYPTPKASVRGDCPCERKRNSPDLEAAVKMYNTPTAQDGKNSSLPQSQIKRGSLVGDVMKEMFATPQARDWKTGQASRWEDREHRSRNLNDQIAMYPTPTTGAGLCGGTGNFHQLKKLKEAGTISEEERRNMSQGNGGNLNPEWVEWLMGFPDGWTDIGT